MNTLLTQHAVRPRRDSRRSVSVPHLSWIPLLVAGAGILLYGGLAAINPAMMATGFESYTSQSWAELEAQSRETATYVLWLYRLVGGLNLGLGIILIALTLGPVRRGERWAWWSVLVGVLVGYGTPMVYDQAVGYIGAFEILEFVVVGAVAITSLFVLSGARHGRRSG
jgi:hypothetical protein